MSAAAATSGAPAQAVSFAWSEEVAAQFPPAFVAFLRANDIHPDNYAVADVPRYVRVGPQHASTLGRQQIEQQLGVDVEPVEWLPGYFRVPSGVKIAGSDAYRAGQLYGIDVSSGAAVAALDVHPGEHVLDLCCAPGAKLCALADALAARAVAAGPSPSPQPKSTTSWEEAGMKLASILRSPRQECRCASL